MIRQRVLQQKSQRSAMNVKNITTLCMLVLTTGVAVWLINWPPSRSIETLVTETHKHISNLNIDVQTRLTGRKAAPKDINLDSYHLELLGFSDSPRLYPKSVATDVILPVIVTVATVINYEKTIKLVDSVQKHLRKHTVIIYDLGLGSYELVKLKKRCNSSEICVVRLIDYLKFPSHLKDYVYMHAYQPIVIQEALNAYGAVIWIDADTEDYFQTGQITDVLQVAQRVGIAAWTIDSMDPTSAFTHPGMFAHFGLKPSNYHFQHMVRGSHLVVYNTARVHSEIMRPWVLCALVAKCVSPAGADHGSCVRKRPRYRYSGCHSYAESALNVVLGLAFNFEDSEYTLSNFTAIFGLEETTSTPISITPSR